jgi:hypothetical protein
MIALCPTCHQEYGKRPKSAFYKLKENPINLRRGRIQGYFGGNKKIKGLKIGNFITYNCRQALCFAGLPIFNYRLVDEEFQINAFIPDKDFWPEIEV